LYAGDLRGDRRGEVPEDVHSNVCSLTNKNREIVTDSGRVKVGLAFVNGCRSPE
jgi:hypothetical protein